MGKSLLIDNIYQALYFYGDQSCSELSKRLHRSTPSVSKLLNILIEHDYVQSNGHAPSTGGRRAVRYTIQPKAGYVVSVSTDQLFTTIVILDLLKNKVTEAETFELNLHTHKKPLRTLAKRIKAHINHSDIPLKKIWGVGMAMPGLVKPKKGMNYTFFDQNMPITHQVFLEEATRLPVFLDNDSSLNALSEWYFGKAKGAKNAMIINIGWGTGLGMILNGKLFRGETGYAGEFSHIPINDNGKLCECGKRGCLETETSLLIMAQEAIHQIETGTEVGINQKPLSYMSEEIMNSAINGNHYSIALLEKIGKALGKGIGILIQIMNPGMIVLGGRGAKAGKIIKAPIDQAIIQNCIPRLAEKVDLTVSDLGKKATLLGAAALVVENISIQKYINENKKTKIAL